MNSKTANILKLDKQMKSFSITYVKEARLGDILDIYVVKNDNTFDIKGVVNNETCFLARVEE